MKQITKTSSLIHNFESFSRDQLKQSKGLGMSLEDKTQLKNLIREDKDHIVVGTNIILWCIRNNLLALDIHNSQGRKIQWIEDNINIVTDSKFIDEI